MTKGNWERRVEMAAMRRAAAKDEKATAERTRNISPVSILSKLNHYQQSAPIKANIVCWVQSADAKEQCRAWFRTGTCTTRKCKLAHEDSLHPAMNVAYSASDPHNEAEMTILEMEGITIPMSSSLRFILIDETCVYDYCNPDLWLDYCRSPQCIFERKVSRKLGVIEDVEDEDFEGACKIEDSSSKVTTTSMNIIPTGILDKSLGFLDFKTLITLMRCSKQARSVVQHDDDSRRKVKEAQDIHSADFVKRKRDERKKKVKNAFTNKNSDKKDGFSRGAR
jgi:hypothetical protein